MHRAAPSPLRDRTSPSDREGDARRVEIASAADDAAIRELLRRSPMGRSIRLAFEREPDFAASTEIEGPRGATVVVRGGDGAALAVGHRSVARRYWFGEPRWIGYLGSLRRDERLAGRWRLLGEGFRAMEATRQADEATFDLTAIVSDNASARRLLERGLPGLPRYRPLESLVTVAIAPKRSAIAPKRSAIAPKLSAMGGKRGALPRGVRLATASDLPSIAASLGRWGRAHDGAFDWSVESITRARLGPAPLGPLLVLEERSEVAGCFGLWDLRSVRQARVQGYGGLLRWLHPVHRAIAPLVGRPGLPRPGASLAIVHGSHLSCASAADEPFDSARHIDRFERLLAAARLSLPADARWLTLTLPRSSPLLPTALAARSGPPIASELYAVGEERALDAACDGRDGRPIHVEGALL